MIDLKQVKNYQVIDFLENNNEDYYWFLIYFFYFIIGFIGLV